MFVAVDRERYFVLYFYFLITFTFPAWHTTDSAYCGHSCMSEHHHTVLSRYSLTQGDRKNRTLALVVSSQLITVIAAQGKNVSCSRAQWDLRCGRLITISECIYIWAEGLFLFSLFAMCASFLADEWYCDIMSVLCTYIFSLICRK